MHLLKIVNLPNTVVLRAEKVNEKVFLYFKHKKKLVLKINFAETFFLNNNKLTIISNKNYSHYINFIRLISKNLELFLYNQLSRFTKIYMIGLGFKNFILGNYLYILVGDCNYIMFSIPGNLKVFCKKNQIYVLGEDEVEIFNFISQIKKVKKPNFYKGKGILEFKNFKFTKLKVGKKQRFM